MARLRPVLDCARSRGATVHLDTEHDEAKDLGYELLRRMGGECPDVQLGCVVQAYRKDSFADLRDLVGWSATALRVPLRIRLVKGAYWDQEEIVATAAGWESPVFARKAETDANFERCTRYLIDHAGEVRPAIASHNLRSLAHAIAYARRCELGHNALELQLLYGMAEPVHAALVRDGHRVRVYAPVGELLPGIAYLVRRLLENTSNESFVRHRFAEGQELDALIRAPSIDEHALSDEPPRPVRLGSDPDAPVPFANEPVAEFRRATARAGFARGIGDAGDQPAFVVPVLLDGKVVATDREITSVDPGSFDRVVCRSGCADRAIADRALDVAVAAWPAWRAMRWDERAAILFRAAAILRARRVELAALEVFEAGKPVVEADADVCEAIDFCEYYGREVLRLVEWIEYRPACRVRPTPTPIEPSGVGVVIAPWNFPLAILTGMIDRRAGRRQRRVVQAGGADARQSRCVWSRSSMRRASRQACCLPPRRRRGGRRLAGRAPRRRVHRLHRVEGGRAADHRTRGRCSSPGQRQVKRVLAEMGGKNAIIVDADADLDEAVPAIMHTAFGVRGPEVLGGVAGDRRSIPYSTSSSSEWSARRGSFRSDRPRTCARSVDRSSTPTRANVCGDTSRWRAKRPRSSSSARTSPAAAGIAGPPSPSPTTRGRGSRRTRSSDRCSQCCVHQTLITPSRSPTTPTMPSPRDCSRARRRASLTRPVPSGERVRQPEYHGRARRASAVRRFRALRHWFQGGRARLPVAVRRIARGH